MLWTCRAVSSVRRLAFSFDFSGREKLWERRPHLPERDLRRRSAHRFDRAEGCLWLCLAHGNGCLLQKCRSICLGSIWKNRLFEVFGFDIPEAVVRTTVRGLQFIKTENSIYHVNQIELKDNSVFEEMKAVAEANNTDIIDLLIAFAQETNPSSAIWADALTQEFIAYLLDDQQTTAAGKYTDLIGRFILKNESDEKIQSALTAIREGSILYIGLNHNISETGSLRKPL